MPKTNLKKLSRLELEFVTLGNSLSFVKAGENRAKKRGEVA